MNTKRIITLLLMLLPALLKAQTSNQLTKISAFKYTGNDLEGCGEGFYLTKAERKNKGKTIILTSRATAAMMINGRLEKLKAVNNKNHLVVFQNHDYRLEIKDSGMKTLDDEYYEMNAAVTLKSGNKIIYTQKLYGNGGC